MRVASEPLLFEMAEETVMFPSWLSPPDVPVVMVTLVPALSALSTVAVVMMALSAVVVKSGLPLRLLSGPVA